MRKKWAFLLLQFVVLAASCKDDEAFWVTNAPKGPHGAHLQNQVDRSNMQGPHPAVTTRLHEFAGKSGVSTTGTFSTALKATRRTGRGQEQPQEAKSANRLSGEGSSKDTEKGAKALAVVISWWDVLLLLLLGLLALCSSAALLAASFVGDAGRRYCEYWGPLRRFIKIRNKKAASLQILASQYEQISEERSRIATLWFVARQMKDSGDMPIFSGMPFKFVSHTDGLFLPPASWSRSISMHLFVSVLLSPGVSIVSVALCASASLLKQAILRKQAEEMEASLDSIRRRYQEERSESSSDSSGVSGRTVESLVHQRIQAEDKQQDSSRASSVSRSDSTPRTSSSRRLNRASNNTRAPKGRGLQGPSRASGVSGVSRWSASCKGSQTEGVTATGRKRKHPKRQEGQSEYDTDDALPPEIPGSIKRDALLAHKFDQLAQRKLGILRRIVREAAQHEPHSTAHP
ncbi:uncharacterized protein LOC34622432 [Cyclospora cayetanensis]|uniref:Uncharacterized protein LOC34622432 n=1 Tax=Cyclospora cayetanensis TaxID=88456 RepID=A0A6P6S2Y1_9EIME|nr:uncharacterized protein LOC34622432 [Cyclospora cayetanensis]